MLLDRLNALLDEVDYYRYGSPLLLHAVLSRLYYTLDLCGGLGGEAILISNSR